jgi:hypothetical protein
VRATFAIVVHGDNATDGPELVVVRGSLSGTIDLSPTIQQLPDRSREGSTRPVRADERSLGIPTVRLELTLQ